MFKYSNAQIVGLSVSFASVILLAFCLSIILKNKSEDVRKIPQRVTTILIFATEITKAILSVSSGDFNAMLPYSFCSFFWFWFVIADFTDGKISDSCKAIGFVGSISMTFMLVVNPSSLFGDSMSHLFSSYINFHHVYFHFLVSFHLIFVVFLNTYNPQKIEFAYIVVWILILSATIVPITYKINSNYMDLQMSDMAFLDNIRLKVGQVLYDFIVIGAVGTLQVGIFFACFYLKKLFTRIKRKKIIN